ncbi:MAG: universal stress protein, partial [Anaerolineales bacterium]|nr:universal stress protein [Anaerolineales bacterium]
GWEVDTKTAVADLAAQEEQRKQGTLARMGDSLRYALTPEELEDGPAPGQWRKMRWREDDWQKMRWYQNRRQWQRWDRLFADYLVPIFGDPSDWDVVDLAVKLAQREKDRLIGVYVVESKLAIQSDEAQQVKTEFLRRCQEGGVYAEFVFEVDDIRVNGILRQAAWADVVIVSLTRPPGVDPLSRLGSRINRLLQRCPRPVMVIPEGARSSLSRMLLCYDGSAKSDEALFVAAYLWLRWPCSLTVVTVVTENTPPETLDEARAYLEERGVDRVEYVLKQKPIAEAVLETAVAYDSNLLIMGGFGFGPVKHIMLGSTVDHLLREFKKPMLICR